MGNEGDSPSDPTVLTDNPGTWLDFTDLVFIDPIGTGFSRASVPEADAKKLFYSTTPDIEYLSRVIYDWLVKNDRLDSRKYLVGESYGGFRGPRITHYLQSQLGVAMNGVVAGLALSESDHRRQWRPFAGALDDDAAVHHRGSPRARKQADPAGDGRRDRIHAGRLRHHAAQRPLRSGCASRK